MKYISFIISLIAFFFLSACTTTPNLTISSSSHTGSITSIPTTGFIISDNISQSSGLITFLQTLTLDQLIAGKYKELIDYKTSRIRVFKLHEEDLIKLGYPKKLENPYDYRLYLILQDGISKQAFRSDQYTPLPIQYGGINEKHIYTLNNNNIEGTGKILYKNFESIIATGVTSFLTSQYNDDIATVKNKIKNKPKTIDYTDDPTIPTQKITITEEVTIQYNNKEIDSTDKINGSTYILQTFQKDGNLIYQKNTTPDLLSNFPNADISLLSYNPNNNIKKTIDHWTGNFLAGNYNIISTDTNAFVIGRSYQERPNDIRESRSTITTGILNIVGNQEKTILKRYRLINQKKYQEAYNLLNNPKQSIEEFVQMWKSYNLISVESINNPLVIFDTYGKLPANVTASNYNIFEPKIFTRSQKGKIHYIEQRLKVDNNNHITIESTDTDKGTIRDNIPPRQQLVTLYYHLIANKTFEEAYAMQANHNQTFEQFKNNYKNILGISIKQASADFCNNDGCSSSNTDVVDGQVQILLDFIEENSVSRYYIQKEIIKGKIKHISSEETTDACKVGCAYGYKPIIYLYPTEKTDINVYLPLHGDFTVTYPSISKDNTWNVTAQPDGTLINKEDQKEYSYLFREGKMKQSWKIQEGFVVNNEDTVTFLQEKLAYLGLTPKEYNEFIVYRRPLMMKNKYNIISFLGDQYTSQSPLTISPKPDSMQRVFMVFQGSDKPVTLLKQKLQPWQRKGFAVVERGGAEIQ